MPGVDEDTVSVDVADPPEVSVMLVWLSDAVEPAEGTNEVERVTVPEKPLRLVRLIVEVPEDPDWTVSDDVPIEMPKSGARVTVTRIEAE